MERISESDTRQDEVLIAAANAGDAAAFETLYYRYRDWVVNLSFRITNDRELALDVLQETFCYFLRKFPGFTLTCQLKTFLYPVVKNLSLAALRKNRRYDPNPDAMDAWAETAHSTEPAFSASEEMVVLLEKMSGAHREVLMLRFVDGLQLQEIAMALAIPVGTVKSRLHQALDLLRRSHRAKKILAG